MSSRPHFECGDLRRITDFQHDFAGLRVFDRVGNQVDQRLAQAFLVGADVVGQLADDFGAKYQALGFGGGAEHTADLVDERGQAHGVGRHAQHAVFDERDIEQAFDEVVQVFGAAADDACCLDRIDRGAAFEQLRIAVDGIERRADLVADVGEIAAFGGIGGFGRVAFALHRAQLGQVLLRLRLRRCSAGRRWRIANWNHSRDGWRGNHRIG